MPELRLDNVSLVFRPRRLQRVTFKEFLLRGMFRGNQPRSEIHALREVQLEASDGDRLGVIGHNGAGKSTLLKVLAGIYPPTSGQRLARGRISSLFDIALGFEADANGWENIRYRAYLQGETPRSVRSKLAAVAEFSELGEFLNLPVRFYSSGMLVRLAFSIATAIDPEILLIDETLSAGDLAFQAKARLRIREIVARARILVLVSHALDALPSLVDRVIWLDHGQVRRSGPAREVIDDYCHSVLAASKAA
jgi:ABC-type polysaccharide/polyol phosphate transport system ATPase subunit